MRRFLRQPVSKVFSSSSQQKRFFQETMAGGATSAKVLVAPILALSSFVAEPALRVRATAVHAETAKIAMNADQVAASGPQSIAVRVETVKTEPKVEAVNAHVVEPQVTMPEQKVRAKFPEPTPVNPKLTVAAGSPCQAPWALVNRRWIARFCLFGYGY